MYADVCPAAQDEKRLQMLADLLLCSQQCVRRMAGKCPELLTMSPAEVTQRLMLLKVPYNRSPPPLQECARLFPNHAMSVRARYDNAAELAE